MKQNVSFNPGQKCTFSTFPPAFKCSFWPGLLCIFSPPILWRGGGIFSNVLFQPGQFAPSHLCLWGRGGISNVLFKLGQFVPSHLCLWGGGVSWFTLSIFYIIFSSFNLILSCERLKKIFYFSLSAGQGQSPIKPIRNTVISYVSTVLYSHSYVFMYSHIVGIHLCVFALFLWVI